jgi:hypothetical protein
LCHVLLGSLPLLYVEVSYGVILKDLKSGSVATGQLLSLFLVLALLAAIPAYLADGGGGEQPESTREKCPLGVAQNQVNDMFRNSSTADADGRACPKVKTDSVFMRVIVPGSRL